MELIKEHCAGIQPLHYPAWNGSCPTEKPRSVAALTFNTRPLDALVNWAAENKQQTLHHLLIAPNQYFPEWFWTTECAAKELNQILENYVTTLMNANDNKSKMTGWNISNEMYVYTTAGREAKVDRIDFRGVCDGLGDSWRTGHKARILDENFTRRETYQAVFKALYDTRKMDYAASAEKSPGGDALKAAPQE